MNGRVYDPMLGIFLSPDNYVQMPDFTQNFNRYSYGLNNPLIFTDPSGEFLDLALFLVGSGLLTGAFFGQDSHGNWDWGRAAKGFVAGVIISGTMVGSFALPGVSFLSGPGALPGFLMAGSQFSMTALNTASFNWMTTGNFEPNWTAAGLSAIPGLVKGIAGGIDAIKHGGDFWTGKGSIFGSPATEGLIPENVKVGEGMEYTTKYANGVADDTYGKLSYVERTATNEVPVGEGYTLNNGCIINKNGGMANGLTKYLGKGHSEVYLGKSAFTSVKQLKLTIGHEYIHATQNYMYGAKVLENINRMAGNVPMVEVAAYNWESTMGVSNGYNIWDGKLGVFSWNRQPYYNWLLNVKF